jgi:hypothetical protein
MSNAYHRHFSSLNCSAAHLHLGSLQWVGKNRSSSWHSLQETILFDAKPCLQSVAIDKLTNHQWGSSQECQIQLPVSFVIPLCDFFTFYRHSSGFVSFLISWNQIELFWKFIQFNKMIMILLWFGLTSLLLAPLSLSIFFANCMACQFWVLAFNSSDSFQKTNQVMPLS